MLKLKPLVTIETSERPMITTEITTIVGIARTKSM
jgi:hypothetical protein